MQIKLRRLEEKDVPRILEMAAETEYRADVRVTEKTIFWSAEELKNWIGKSKDPLIVAEREGKIIGFIFFSIHQPTKKATLENILVEKQYRRKGIGSQLLKEALREIKKQKIVYICSLVRTDNQDVAACLIANGFTQGYKFFWLEKTWRNK